MKGPVQTIDLSNDGERGEVTHAAHWIFSELLAGV